MPSFTTEPSSALVRLRRAAQITLPHDIREAAHIKEGDYLEAEVTESGAILLRTCSNSF